MKKAYIQTFGCQMNEHDSRRMRHLLDQEGFEPALTPEEAELVVLNTCSVREKPEHKVYSLVGRLAQLKAKRPEMVIAVAGCVAQQEGKKILRRQKAVDLVFGPDQLFNLPQMLADVKAGKRGVYTEWAEREKKVQNFIPEEELAAGEVEGGQGMVVITKGCDNHCSFCIVPRTRGALASREPENILAEAADLIEKGAKEILLLGQNVNSYQVGNTGFLELLKEVAELPGLKRLRFMSPHPNDWNLALTELMAQKKVLAKALHLPFQAGSDRILAEMRRDHTKAQYLEKLAQLRERIPNLQLTTDVIVGYPTETEAEFGETLAVIEAGRFFQIYGFMYSPRPGTKATKLEDNIPLEVKEARLQQVIALQGRIQNEILDEHLGQDFELLIDSAHPDFRGTMQGRTEGGVRVSVADPDLEIGDLVQVQVTERRDHSLVGVRR